VLDGIQGHRDRDVFEETSGEDQDSPFIVEFEERVGAADLELPHAELLEIVFKDLGFEYLSIASLGCRSTT
jgi:hypothetical protein